MTKTNDYYFPLWDDMEHWKQRNEKITRGRTVEDHPPEGRTTIED